VSSICESRADQAAVDGAGGRRPAQIALVLSGWPRVSETFAINELLALQRAGMLAAAFAIKPGDRTLCQPDVAALDEHVEVLPDSTADEQAAIVAERLATTPVAGVHGYFAHQPAAVAEIAANRLGVPFGFSAHALDVRKVTRGELARRAAAAAVVVACNADVAAALRNAGAMPRLVGHGVDAERFAPNELHHGDGLRLLAVGRLVAKKGFDVLVDTMTRVDPTVTLTIVGDGPEREELLAAIAARGLTDHITIAGRITHDALPAVYAAADAVVVPSRVDRSDDRDGLPNVLLEAMSSGRPVIASDVAAIGTAVRDGHTGLLVPSDDPVALAHAIDALRRDPVRRRRLGDAAREHVLTHHELASCSRHLVATLEQAYG
jgi:glycosyltransferase involved in cell wall biosynthesis